MDGSGSQGGFEEDPSLNHEKNVDEWLQSILPTGEIDEAESSDPDYCTTKFFDAKSTVSQSELESILEELKTH